MKSVTFKARSGGDGECFRWEDISKEDMIAVLDEEEYEKELKDKVDLQKEINEDIITPEPLPEAISTLHPGDVLSACGVDYLADEKYEITVSVKKL